MRCEITPPIFLLLVSASSGQRWLALPPPSPPAPPPSSSSFSTVQPVVHRSTMSQGQNFLPKFLFVSNLLKAMKIRQRVPNDVVKPAASGGLMHHLRSMHRYTLEMIAMNHFPQAFREVVQAAILDRAMQASLEQEKKLNWCREVKKMVPLRTNGKRDFIIFRTFKGYMLHVRVNYPKKSFYSSSENCIFSPVFAASF